MLQIALAKAGRLFAGARPAAHAADLAEEARRRALDRHSMARLTGGVAHAINNRLQTVSGSLELLGDLLAGNEEAAELIRTIAESAERGAEITHQLMAFCRQQDAGPAGRTDLRLAMDRLGDLLPLAVGSARVVFALPARPGMVAADPGQLELCLLDVGLTLFDAKPLAGLVVRLRHCTLAEDDGALCRGDYAVISMASAAAPVIPGGSAADTELAMRVRRAAGVARSTATAGGFGVDIWLRTLAAPQAGPSAAPAALLVGDASDVLITLSAFLEGEGISVVLARSGAEAVSALAARRFDVAIADCGRPGAAVLGKLRAVAPRLPAVLVTGSAVAEAPAGLPGGIEVLRKPFRREQLVNCVRALIRPVPTLMPAMPL